MILEYAVLLENYSPLPYLDWGDEVARLMDEHQIDVNNKLRNQQGIVWDELDRIRADRLGGYLIEKGYPSGLVEMKDVVEFGKPKIIRNADPVEDGLEIEDIWEKKSILRKGEVLLAQVGYVEEEVTTGELRKYPSSGVSGQSHRHKSFNYSTEEVKEIIGHVLFIYLNAEPVGVVRIAGAHFNYDYQQESESGSEQRFMVLLNDLADIFQVDCLDPGYKDVVGATTFPDTARYKTLRQMIERARWELTLKRVMG